MKNNYVESKGYLKGILFSIGILFVFHVLGLEVFERDEGSSKVNHKMPFKYFFWFSLVPRT